MSSSDVMLGFGNSVKNWQDKKGDCSHGMCIVQHWIAHHVPGKRWIKHPDILSWSYWIGR